MSWLLQENYRLFVDLNHYAGRVPVLDGIMIFCANVLIFFWPVLLLLLWGRPRAWRSRPLRQGESDLIQTCRVLALGAVGACLLAVAFNLGLEHVLFEPRPFVTHAVHLLIAHPADASFPSDHTAVSFAVVGMLLFTLPALLLRVWKQRRAVAHAQEWHNLLLPLVLMGVSLLIACSIGIARVFVGIHYPGDILGGALSGLAAAAIMTVALRVLRQPADALVRFAERFHLA